MFSEAALSSFRSHTAFKSKWHHRDPSLSLSDPSESASRESHSLEVSQTMGRVESPRTTMIVSGIVGCRC